MAVFKCKMCGGELDFQEHDSIAVCAYCGTKQTLPKLDSEKSTQLYERANHFRRLDEFDKAMGIYEMILSENKEDPEAYWGLVLCRYGIEYVEDPRSHKRIPTVNRAQFTSIFDDQDYQSALQYADAAQREVYEAEAKNIDTIQKGILEISSKEEPFDVFICYKETDADGERTKDSVYAQDLYDALTKEGYKVFFSRITLESKLGSAYEPYIFAALNSSKVMLAVGTSKDNYNAIWVKNEWSRYLGLMKEGKDKTLIPVYKDMDPYDMPEEFSYLQAQDMNKVGFLQDLLRGVKKIVTSGAVEAGGSSSQVVNNAAQVRTHLERADQFFATKNFKYAESYVEKALDIDPHSNDAFLRKIVLLLKPKSKKKLEKKLKKFDCLLGECDRYEQVYETLKKDKKKNKIKRAVGIPLLCILLILLYSVCKYMVLPFGQSIAGNNALKKQEYVTAYSYFKQSDVGDRYDIFSAKNLDNKMETVVCLLEQEQFDKLDKTDINDAVQWMSQNNRNLNLTIQKCEEFSQTLIQYEAMDWAEKFAILSVFPEEYVHTEAFRACSEIMHQQGINRREEITALKSYWDLEIIQHVLLSENYITEFVYDTWRGNGKYIDFDRDGLRTYFETNLPAPSGFDSFDFEENARLVYMNGNRKVADVFQFDFVNADTMHVYCYENGKTYTLYRQ